MTSPFSDSIVQPRSQGLSSLLPLVVSAEKEEPGNEVEASFSPYTKYRRHTDPNGGYDQN